MHDARVIRCSTIFRRAEGGDILTAPTVNINGNEKGPYLIGDSAYPLGPWLMKPYPEGTRDRDETKLNKELSSARVKVECPFGLPCFQGSQKFRPIILATLFLRCSTSEYTSVFLSRRRRGTSSAEFEKLWRLRCRGILRRLSIVASSGL